MPGWHAKTKGLVASGKLQVYGIAPEQYGDRMALFLQWKELDFPVLMDPLNVLGVEAVPITLLVDEGGVIRYRNPKPNQFKEFLEKKYPATKNKNVLASLPPATELMQKALMQNDSKQGLQCLSTSGKKLSPAQSFQAGVVARWLYDQNLDPELFQAAVDHWKTALKSVPSQYIWRRRIQQYGPRLDKPYPFYNWVETARKEIRAKGGQPVKLTVEPSGSEVASPLRKNEQAVPSQEFPDLENKLPLDQEFLKVITTLIPHTDKSDHQRIHLQLSPQQTAHWASDTQEVALWLLPKKGDPILLADTASPLPPEQESSDETRTLEADISKRKLATGKLILFYALCEEENGVCRFLKAEVNAH